MLTSLVGYAEDAHGRFGWGAPEDEEVTSSSTRWRRRSAPTSMGLEIVFLVDYPETIPTLTHWFLAQWPQYYAARTAADIAQDFRAEAKRDGLPVRLLAFTDGELAGTITLRDQAISSLPAYHPGLGGLLVVERHRGRGIATELVRAGMNLARAQGYARVYATTVTARGILERLGWQLVQEVLHGDEQLMLYGCELEDHGPTPHVADPVPGG